ncbi:mCpol domain-containing protein [Shewanella sp. SM32]|uniref:mCpol domain-containing protein n=1 Tax=Shewanella sp. SM32 TaxID=2912796 RepID=UPI0021DB4419|nr:mCpol domain-containing protein [Shewanella sp. SM32]MCU8069462.1 mCpol domain-containing protein [Shewanella sp. SM32]
MPSRFITIDGDDIGQLIVSCYLRNDQLALARTNALVNNTTEAIADFLSANGFSILFCAADGVAAYTDAMIPDDKDLYSSIKALAGDNISFSVGIGASLREAYVALLSAKSSGKARLHNYKEVGRDVQNHQF